MGALFKRRGREKDAQDYLSPIDGKNSRRRESVGRQRLKGSRKGQINSVLPMPLPVAPVPARLIGAGNRPAQTVHGKYG